jgi:hypothetical protein
VNARRPRQGNSERLAFPREPTLFGVVARAFVGDKRRDPAPATRVTPSRRLRSFAGVAIVAASFAAFFIIFRALAFGQRQSEMWGALCSIGLWSIVFWAIAVKRQARSSSPPLKREPFFGSGALEWGLFILSWIVIAAAVRYFRGG